MVLGGRWPLASRRECVSGGSGSSTARLWRGEEEAKGGGGRARGEEGKLELDGVRLLGRPWPAIYSRVRAAVGRCERRRYFSAMELPMSCRRGDKGGGRLPWRLWHSDLARTGRQGDSWEWRCGTVGLWPWQPSHSVVVDSKGRRR
jgi:hypothetical protein